MEISKELIIKVMDIKYPFSDIQLNSNILSWWREDVFFEETMKINIYEFIFKCKEWALSKDYVISSYSKYKLDGYNCTIYCNNGEIDEDFTSDTEVEAIIKACNWILEQSKCQN